MLMETYSFVMLWFLDITHTNKWLLNYVNQMLRNGLLESYPFDNMNTWCHVSNSLTGIRQKLKFMAQVIFNYFIGVYSNSWIGFWLFKWVLEYSFITKTCRSLTSNTWSYTSNQFILILCNIVNVTINITAT